jgi:hydroxyacylglutathione hydrolase
LVLVCESAPERLAATFSLLQAGFNIIGYTEVTPGLLLEVFSQLTIHQLWREISQGRLQRNLGLIDVRSLAEWDEYHIEGATHLPYFEVPQGLQELDRHKELVVVAGTRYHSLTVISFLKQHGFDRLDEVPAGMTGWARSGLPIKRGS